MLKPLLRALTLWGCTLIATVLLSSCGGEAADPPGGVNVTAGENSVTLTWNAADGVEYWIFYGPTSVTPSRTDNMQLWIGLPGGSVALKATSPYTLAGLSNGISYSFTLNARTNGGPGGPGSTPVSAMPRPAGNTWVANTAAGSAELKAAIYGTVTSTTTTPVTVTPTYVAAGKGGVVFTSTNNTTWTPATSGTSANLNGGAFLGGKFALVGDGGVLLTSTDAVTWTAQTTGTTQNLSAIAGNGVTLQVIVGTGGTILTSPDGVTWTAASSGTSADLYTVAYSAPGVWLAGGANGTLLKSADGLTWSAVGSNTSFALRGFAYGLADATNIVYTYVAVGDNGTLLTSPDASTWTVGTSGTSADLRSVVYNTQFVAAGRDGGSRTSTDTATWTAATVPGSGALNAVIHGAYLYMAVGDAGTNWVSK
jgi:hypothetical protein